MTDAELIEATQRGEREAFGLLVERYQRMVEAAAFAATGRDVEDVVQDTFVTAWDQLGRLRDPSRVRPWLYGIARNLACKARRSWRREVPADELVASTTPFEEVSRLERDRRIAAGLARLPDRYREPMVLFYYEHCTVEEVASALGLRADAVMQRLSRGRRMLGEELALDVEVELERKPSRKGLAACVLAVLAFRAAPAHAGTATSTSVGKGVLLWLAAHVRVAGMVGATAVGASIVVAASSHEVKPRRAADAEVEVDANAAKPVEPSRAPSPPPQLPNPDDTITHRAISLATIDPKLVCRGGARGLVIQTLGQDSFRREGENVYFEPSPALERTLDLVGERAAASCGGDVWPELYVACEGTMAEILEGNVTCYPYDIFERG